MAIRLHLQAPHNAPYKGRNGTVRATARSHPRWAAVLTLATLVAFAPAVPASELDVGAMAPNFTLKSTHNENLRLGEHAGTVRALLFTASWCGSCVDALRELQSLTPKMQHYGFNAWAINMDDDPAKTRHTAQQLGLGYPMLIDNGGRVAKLYWIDDLPALFLLDRDGRIRLVLEGDDVKNTTSIADTLTRIAEE